MTENFILKADQLESSVWKGTWCHAWQPGFDTWNPYMYIHTQINKYNFTFFKKSTTDSFHVSNHVFIDWLQSGQRVLEKTINHPENISTWLLGRSSLWWICLGMCNCFCCSCSLPVVSEELLYKHCLFDPLFLLENQLENRRPAIQSLGPWDISRKPHEASPFPYLWQKRHKEWNSSEGTDLKHKQAVCRPYVLKSP